MSSTGPRRKVRNCHAKNVARKEPVVELFELIEGRELEDWETAQIVDEWISILVGYLDRRSSAGDARSASALARIASSATSRFQDLLLKHPEWFYPQFVASESVPVMLSNRTAEKKLAQRVVDVSKVGSMRNLETRGKQAYSIAADVASFLYSTVFRRRLRIEANAIRCGLNVHPERIKKLEEEGAFLPEFSRDLEVQKLWWPHCRKVLTDAFGASFEDAKVFQSYWTRDGIRNLEGRAKKNEVRKRIFKDLKQALRALAKDC